MTPEAVLLLQEIMDYCHAKWEEADRAADQTPDMRTGRKIGYNDVLKLARKRLAGPSDK